VRERQFADSGSLGKQAEKTHTNSDSEALLNRKEKVRAAAVCRVCVCVRECVCKGMRSVGAKRNKKKQQ